MSMSVSNVPGAGMPAMSGASMQAPPHEKMSNLYGQIDTAGAGAINQAQFAQAFQAMGPRRPAGTRRAPQLAAAGAFKAGRSRA